MRCFTLANELRTRGAYTRFIVRHMPSLWVEKLSRAGHGVVELPNSERADPVGGNSYSHWLGVSQEQDAVETTAALSDSAWDWMVVDHYALDGKWSSALRPAVGSILVIDDLADRAHDCDLLLDQNLHTDAERRYMGRVPASCGLLLGPRYALLRREFATFRTQSPTRAKAVERIFVSFGGVDRDNLTMAAIDTLRGLAGVDVDVIIGASHADRSGIEGACAKAGYSCHVQVDELASIMASADLAIGAGGISTWERCCLGLPTLAICVAENQREQLQSAAAHGLVYSPELSSDDLSAFMARHLGILMENRGLRALISATGMQAVDGLGARRVARRMHVTDLQLRLATVEDEESLWLWRNDRAIRESSMNSSEIARQEHNSWFQAVRSDPNRVVLIGRSVLDETDVGVVRFDIANRVASVSIYLVPSRIRTVSGGDLLDSAELWLRTERPDVQCIRADVLGHNDRSNGLFASAGYSHHSSTYHKQIA